MVTAISVTLTPTHTHTHTPFSSCHEHDRARGSAWATSDLKHPIISHSIAGGRRGERLLVVVVVVVEGGGCPFSASPSPHVTASCIDCWAWWWRGPGWWKGGLFLSRMLYWSLAPSHTQPHTHTHTHTRGAIGRYLLHIRKLVSIIKPFYSVSVSILLARLHQVL